MASETLNGHLGERKGAELVHVPLAQLTTHPNNPRLVMREDVIASISGQISEHGFSVAHGLLVRAVNGGFQIISGHHRKEAAQRAGLDAVPCFVEEMTEERANMMLVLCNAQGELSLLERGVHVLKTVPIDEKRGRGKTGGIAAYADEVGESHQRLFQLRSAARVLEKLTKLQINLQLSDLLSKSTHLTAIHDAPEESWSLLAAKLSDDAYTVAKVKDDAKMLKEIKASIPSWWPADFLAIAALALRSPQEPARLRKMYQEAAQANDNLKAETLYSHTATDETIERDGRDYTRFVAEPYEYDAQGAFRRALFDNATIRIDEVRAALKDVRAHIKAHSDSSDRFSPILTDEEWAEMRARQEEEEREMARQVERNRVHCGDCLSALQFWHGGTIHLLVTDPPYGMAFQSNRRVVSAKADKIAGDAELEEATSLLSSMLVAAHPHMAEDAHILVFVGHDGIPAFRRTIEQSGFAYKGLFTWVKPNHTTGDLFGAFATRTEFIIHAVKGAPDVNPRRDNVYIQKSWERHTDHPTEKPVELLEYVIACTSADGDLVIDPFCGTGSTLVAAQRLGRRYWGAELEDHYAEVARDRITAGLRL